MKASLLKSETPGRRLAPHGNERRLVTRHPRRRILSLAAGAAALPAMSRMNWAQVYPSRPVRLIVGLPPGGSADLTARVIGQWLSERFGQQLVVENRPGAVSNIATEAAVRAPADGYTLLLVNAANATSATFYSNLNFNFIRDIAPVAGIIRVPLVMEVNPSVPARTLPEFIGYAKANPGKVNYATAGNGSTPHVTGELFKMMTGVNIVHVPYRGSAPALTDVLGGQVQMMLDALPASIEYVRTGKLRALAVTTAARSPALPDIPTVGEFMPGFEGSTFFGVGAPRGTPVEIIDKLNTEINAALANPKIKAKLAELGGTPIPGSPDDFGTLIADETEKWGKVIRAANIKAE
jgi:tripartite-type tricarboxylate transporter receptor subunit TctC